MNKKLFLIMLCLLTTLFLLPACSDDESVDTPKESPTPVSDGDWQEVPLSGGTIKKDSISITFPSGTFSGDTKVAISNVSKGKIYGDLEVSPFYQITMPITTNKATTIKIKCQKLDEDVSFVFNAIGYGHSACKYNEGNIILDATWSNGEYSVTLPAFDNGDETTNDYFAIGLAHIMSIDNNTRASNVVEEGTTKGIKWKLYIDPSVKNFPGWEDYINYRENQKIKQYIIDAITKITDLGFTLRDKDRVIPYYYYFDWDCEGTFYQVRRGDSSNWIAITVNGLRDAALNNDNFTTPCSVLHETFHYFQADYDPRWAWVKAGGLAGEFMDNQNILYEMGAVWIEQYVNNGQLNAKFLKDEVFKKAFHKGSELKSDKDKLGFGLEVSRWGDGNNTANNKNKCNQQQGYTMGPWLYYMTTQMKDYGFSKSSVLELHELWRKNWVNKSHNSYHILNDWVKLPNHDADFVFRGSNIDDYYLMLLQGKLVKDFSIGEILKDEKSFVIDKVGKQYEFEGQCYAFGCGIRKILLNGFKDISLEDKELVVRQESPNVHTCMAITQKKTNYTTYNLAQKNGEVRVIAQGDSMVIRGSTLEQLRETDGSIDTHIYLITTNSFNVSVFDDNINPFKVSIELRDKKQEETPTSSTITGLTMHFLYRALAPRDQEYNGHDIGYEFGWYNTPTIKSTLNGTTMHVEATNNYVEYEYDVYNSSLSFDIEGFSGDMSNCVIKNLKYSGSYENTKDYGNTTIIGDRKAQISTEISNLKIVKDKSKISTTPGQSELYFKSTVEKGLIVTSCSANYEDFDGRKYSYTYLNSPDNEAEVQVSF